VKRICLWSGPRNVSTALMYSFAQRKDTQVLDEPLYGHYLRVSGAEHPGREEIMAAMNCNGDEVMAELSTRSASKPVDVLFMKQMAHHLQYIDRGFLDKTENILLIRNPEEMLPSLTIQLPHANLHDTGLAVQWDLYQELVAKGASPAVIDSRELLLNPESIISKLCRHLGLEFCASMLTWPAGGRKEDGIWEKYWYQAVHQSTGFAPYKAKSAVPDELMGLLSECRPYYDKLYAQALRA
jgi:hypothetical protein